MSADDWKIYYSEKIKMKYAVNKKSGVVRTEDHQNYSVVEQGHFIKNDLEITKPVHNVKKIFDGVIVGVEMEANDGK